MSLCLEDVAAPEGFERLMRVSDPDAGLTAYICVHSTLCGPAAGGCRMWRYDSEEDARRDVLRLAEGMTYKNAIADLGLGGGKSVIIGDPHRDKSDAMFQAFGRAVDAFQGRYYTAEDVGISPRDMAVVASQTPYAVGLEQGEHSTGDPSPFTAEGVFECLRTGATHVFGSADLSGRVVLVQGLGHVGMALAERLHGAGARLIVSDINTAATEQAARDLQAEICPPDQVFDAQMDIFAPCALGGILDAGNIARLSARLVCGAANNQLASEEMAEALRARGITYLPDYVVNGGGIISVAGEIHKAGPVYRRDRLSGIAQRIGKILERSDATGQTTTAVARDMVQDILARAREVQS